jgi:hypothetical protein
MDPKVLTVYKSPFAKIRLGKVNDGGYIIASLPNIEYSLLLSGGIEQDISFEEDFISHYPNVKTFAFDGTIDRLPHENNKIVFVRKNIGFHETDQITNLHEFIDNNDSIMIKMDIEGGEIPWIKSLSTEQIDKFEQIVIEFHNPFSEEEIEVFDKICNSHYLIHFHGNNFSPILNHKGIDIPCVFECTYLHKKYFTSTPELNSELIPTSLDMRNNPHTDEIYIDYEPFVN